MATSYEWVRHVGAVSPFGGITDAVANAFGAYTSDNFFGVRTIINPLPSTPSKDYTWRSKVERSGNLLFDTEWKFRIVGSTPTLEARSYNAAGTPGSWVNQTAALAGMPSGLLVLDSVFQAAISFAGQDPNVVEDYIAGTTDAEFDRREDGVLIAGGIGAPAGVLGIGGFDIRALAIKNLRAEKPVTDLESTENTVNIKADIMALPASTSLFPSGWMPSSDADYLIELGNYSGSETYWTPPTGVATVSSPTGTGKVAEIDLTDPGTPDPWNGKDASGYCIQGLSVFVSQVAADNPDGLTYSVSRVKANACITYNCPKDALKRSLRVESTASPSGQGLEPAMSYTSFDNAALPASLGYGWASEASSRIVDQSGELIYKSASGSHLRWIEQSGDYVPFSPGNYVEAEVDTGSTSARYKLTFKDQTVLEFDTTGKLKRKVDRNGNAISYTHNGTTGFLETISDGNGRSHHYTNRADGQPSTLRVNNATTGRLTQFLYYSGSDPDSPDRLFRTTDPEGNETDLYYYTDGALWATIDPQWNVAEVYGYDNFDRVYTEEIYGELLRIHLHNYNNINGRTTHEIVEQDIVGSEPDRSRYMEFDRHGNVVRQLELVDYSVVPVLYNETLFEYTDTNNPRLLTKQTDPNLTVTEMTYTANGNLKTTKDKDGNVTTYTYAEEIDSPLNPKHRNLVRKIQRPTVTVGGSPVTYDPTIFEYDINGNLIKVIDAAAEETEMTYTSDGLVETVTNRLGHTTEFVYEGLPFNGDSRRLLEVKTPKGDSPMDGFRTVTFEYDDYDNVTSVKDDLGNEVLTDYDGIDRPVEVTDPLGKVTTNTFAAMLLQDVTMPSNNGSSSLERLTSMVYDTSNRLVEVKRDVNSMGGQQSRVKYAFTSFSQMSALTRSKNGSDKSFTFSYDQLGRQISVADSLAVPGVSSTVYEPFCVGHATTSARGVRRKMSFDSRCLLRQVDSGDIDVGDPLEVDDIRETREWDYDELGRMIQSSQTRSTTFNPVVLDIDLYGAAAEVRTFEYDELDRLLKMTFEDSTDMLWEYDLEGRVTKTTDPDSKVTEYTYFRDGLLKEVIIKRPPAADLVFTYSYDAAGRLQEIEYPTATKIVAKFEDGTTPGTGWDAKGQLLHLRYEKNGTLVRRFQYAYDNSGNRVSQLDVTPTKAIKWEYVYDWLDRLEIVRRADAVDVPSLPGTIPTVSIYTYDASDNRIEFEVPQAALTYRYVVDDADNLTEIHLTDGGNPEILLEAITVDDDGNMLTRTDQVTTEVISYGWDDFDRLLSVSSSISGRKQDNRYHTEGIRKRKLDINDNVSNEYSAAISTAASNAAAPGSTSPTISYIMGHQILGAEVNGNFRFHLMDAQGSVRDVVDDSGAVIRSMEFQEHGQLLNSSGSGTISPKTYQGGLSVNDDRDDSGLYLMGHRHWSSSIGRFISRDPIGFGGGLNLFGGHGKDPMNLVDPSGNAYVEVTYAGTVPGTDLYSGYPSNAMTNNPPADLPTYTVRVWSDEGAGRVLLAEAKDATSGWEGYQPYRISPNDQSVMEQGPTPRGVYRIFCGEKADTQFPWEADVNSGDRTGVKSNGWGGARVLLNPVRGADKGFPFGRSQMYLHLHENGSMTRTSGCVGMIGGRGGGDVFDALQEVCKKLKMAGLAAKGMSPSIKVTVSH